MDRKRVQQGYNDSPSVDLIMCSEQLTCLLKKVSERYNWTPGDTEGSGGGGGSGVEWGLWIAL